MPVHGMNVSKRPGNTAETEPVRYVRVFIDVAWIIIVDEVVPEGLPKDKPGQGRQRDAEAKGLPEPVGL